MGGLGGALLVAPLLALAAAAASKALYGPFGSAALASGQTGGVVGLLVGFGCGVWLITRQGGRWAGASLAWLWVGVGIVLVCLAYVTIAGLPQPASVKIEAG